MRRTKAREELGIELGGEEFDFFEPELMIYKLRKYCVAQLMIN